MSATYIDQEGNTHQLRMYEQLPGGKPYDPCTQCSLNMRYGCGHQGSPDCSGGVFVKTITNIKNKKEQQMPETNMILETDSAARKNIPITTGVLDYFPRALAAVAKCSKAGNDQHNPGQPLHWDKTKSTDHADCISRHLIDRKSVDTDGIPHAYKLAWRALALLENMLEAGEVK